MLTLFRIVNGALKSNCDDLPYLERLRLSDRYQRAHRGYSTCHRCQMPWTVVTPKSVAYQTVMVPEWGDVGVEQASGFAICQACWNELGTAEARIPYYAMLPYQWIQDRPTDIEALTKTFADEIHRMSQEETVNA